MTPRLRHLHMLARIGRSTTHTRDQLAEQLGRHAPPEEVKEAIDAAFAIPEDVFKKQINGLAQAMISTESILAENNGKNIDARGMDDADRIAESIAHSSLGLTDPKSTE